VSNNRALAAAAQTARTAVPSVYVFQPTPAPDSGLVLAGTTGRFKTRSLRSYQRLSEQAACRYRRPRPAGQLLAEIASPEVEQQLSQSRANLRQSEKNLDLQKATLDSRASRWNATRPPTRKKAVAIRKRSIQSVARSARLRRPSPPPSANVESNQANVRQLEQMTSFQRVVAPFAAHNPAERGRGALITAGSPTDNTAVAPSSVTGTPNGLFEVAQVDRLRVFVNVPQPFAPSVRAGTLVQLTVRGQLEAPVAASVTRTSSALDPGTRTLLAQVDIPTRPVGWSQECSSTSRSTSHPQARDGACRRRR